MRLAVALILVCLLSGCTRAWYRKDADKEVYGEISERSNYPPWYLPRITLDTPPESRLFDPANPDRPPMPPDDPFAHQYMVWVDGMKGSKKWYKNGVLDTVEFPDWRAYLQLNDKKELVLSSDRAVELGTLNSREYQTALEVVYISGLMLSLSRFEFALQWFATNNTDYVHFGSASANNETNTLTTTSNAGYTKLFAAGGQLMADITNSFIFEFTGPYQTTTTSNIVVNFLQPLLRRAGRQFVLEGLTQAERNLLYEVRDFARFRKQFTVDVTTNPGQGFLGLLLQVQNVRNAESNLESLEENLRLHEALFTRGIVSVVQVDQVYQRYQEQRVSLLRQQTALQNSLDAYKISLGLPPSLPVKLDDSQLNPFQLVDPAVTTLQAELDKFFGEYRELDEAPSLPRLREGFTRLKQFNDRTLKLVDQLQEELGRWKQQIDEPDAAEDEAQATRKRASYRTMEKQIPELRQELLDFAKRLGEAEAALAEGRRKEDWETLQRRIQQQIALSAQVFVLQTQIRVYLIRLPAIRWKEDTAIHYALANRLDLMNQRAQVVDAWRLITVEANRLRADLNVFFNANIATRPDYSNPVDFRSSSSRYQVGVEFKAPLNRLAERNIYRRSLINFQQARRAYMALDDQIQQAIRRDLRNLETERLNFEIARQSLITAARQVEAAREQLLLTERAAETTTTQDILNALNTLLATKSTLISSWVAYESTRMQLLLDTEALQLDDRGLVIPEKDTPGNGLENCW